MLKRLCYSAVLLLLNLTASAQNPTRITGSYTDQTLAQVLNIWTTQYALQFAFDSYELNQYRGSWRFNNASPENALSELLLNTPFVSQFVDETLIIFPVAQGISQVAISESRQSIVSGIVTDRLTGERLPYAGVGLAVLGISVLTDEFGRFSFVFESGQSVDTIAVAYVGYQSYKQAVRCDGRTSEMRIELVAASTFFKDVIIRADSLRSPEVTIKPLFAQLNPNGFQCRYGLGEADVFRVVQILPGVSGSQEYSNGLYIRGSNSDQCQLLFDGFNIYHQDHFFGMISSINAYAVKSMRLQKGPADVTHGGRAAGVLELIGKEGDLRRASARMEMGTLSLSGAVEAPLDSSGKASIFIAARRSITDAFQSPAYTQLFNTIYSSAVVYARDERVDAFAGDFKPALLFQDMNAKLTFRPNERAYFNVSMYASRDDLEFKYADTTSNESIDVSDVRYSDETAKVNRGFALRWNQRINPKTETITSIGFSKFSGSYFSSDSIRNNLFLIDSTQFSFRSMALNDWTIRHHWEVTGAEHAVKLGFAANHMDLSDAKRSSAFESSQSHQEAWVMTLFAGDDWRLNKRLTIHYGSRLNYYTKLNRMQVEPRLSMNWIVSPQRLQLRCEAGRAFQYIQRTGNQSLYQNTPDVWVLSDQTIPILYSDQLSLGGQFQLGSWSFDLELYRKWNNGQVANLSNVQSSEYVWGKSDALGADLMVQFIIKSHRAIVSYSRMNALSTYEPWLAGNIMESYCRNHELKFNYEWKRGRWSVAILQLFASGTPYTSLLGTYSLTLPGNTVQRMPIMGDPNTNRTSWYMRTDLLVGYQWNWGAHRLALNAGVYNLFDRENFRGIQYSVARNSAETGDYTIQQRKILMIGRIPSVHLLWQF